ncbi:MAG: hypothetical protein ACXVC7_10495 [Bacteroidia bacterium]
MKIIFDRYFSLNGNLFRSIVVIIFYAFTSDYVGAQAYYKCKIRLLSSHIQINEPSDNYLKIRKVEMNKNNIEITLKDKKKIIVSPDTIWGFQIKETRNVVRAYNGGLYNLKRIDSLILYSQKDYGSDFFEYIYYFSFKLDSEIHLVNKSVIRKVFSKNECVLKKLKALKLMQFPADWDEKHQTVRFMLWFKECKT